MSWTRLCTDDDVSEGEMRAFEIGETRVALYCVDGHFFATSNVCPHAFALLTDGWLDGTVVECPLHAAQFDICTGAVLSGPADCALQSYPLRQVDGWVEVELEVQDACSPA